MKQKGIIVTNGQLIMWYQQLQSRMADVDYMMTNRNKIDWFQSVCAPLVKQAQDRLNTVQKEYCVFDGDKLRLQSKTEEEVKNNSPSKVVLLEGKSMEEFDKKSNEIWNELKTIAV